MALAAVDGVAELRRFITGALLTAGVLERGGEGGLGAGELHSLPTAGVRAPLYVRVALHECLQEKGYVSARFMCSILCFQL